jgi:hypothetical protein
MTRRLIRHATELYLNLLQRSEDSEYEYEFEFLTQAEATTKTITPITGFWSGDILNRMKKLVPM